MKRIGEFAKENHITIRALHHYEQLGLIQPEHVDRFTGYRYYKDEQRTHLQTIITLKGLGFSLSEISGLLSCPQNRDELLRTLSQKHTQARIELDAAQTRQLGLEALIRLVESCPTDQAFDLKEINEMSIKDIRNRIPNADLFKETVNAAYQTAKQTNSTLTAIVFDLDHLVPLNKKYGHTAGDEVLDKLVSLIIAHLPSNGQLGVERSWLERKGGDEFCAILEGGSADTALKISKAVNDDLSKTDFNHVGMDIPATVTAGIADLASGAKNAGELIHFAETALYEAKRSEGQGVCKVY